MAVFGPFKAEWRKVVEAARSTAPGKYWVTIPKEEFPRLLNITMSRMRYRMPRILTSGFRTCGILPCKVKPLLDKIGSEQAKELDADMIGGCLREFLEEREEALCQAEEAKVAKTQAKKKLKVVVGKLISVKER